MKFVWKALILTAGFLALGLTGWGIARAIERSTERKMKIQPLTQLKLRPQAFGRYVINLPEGVQLVNWQQSFQGTGPIRVAKGVTVEQFHSITEHRAEELRHLHHKDGGTILEKIVDLQLPYAWAVTYWEDKWAVKKLLIECDAFYLRDGCLYRFRNSIDLDPVEQADYFRGFKEMLRSIQPRRPDEIPTVSGSCFDGAILLDGPNRDYSDLVMTTGIWPDRPDVRFQLAILDNGPNPDPPLLTRLEHANALRGPGVLRSRDRTVGGLKGQEQLERVTERNGTEGHLFIWETQGEANRWDLPQIRVEMSSGEGPKAPQDTSLTDQDALALWDQIVDSLHWRPSSNPPSVFERQRR